MMKRGLMLFVVITSVLASAVSFSTAFGEPTSAPPNPCELYTQADADGLFNESVSTGVLKETTLPAGASCRYSFKKKGGTFGLTVTASTTQVIREQGIFDSAPDAFSRTKRALLASEYGSKKFKAIQGLGDDAFWNGTDLWMLKGDTLVIITVHSVLEGSYKNMQEANSVHSEQNLALSRDVAAKVLSRMK